MVLVISIVVICCRGLSFQCSERHVVSIESANETVSCPKSNANVRAIDHMICMSSSSSFLNVFGNFSASNSLRTLPFEKLTIYMIYFRIQDFLSPIVNGNMKQGPLERKHRRIHGTATDGSTTKSEKWPPRSP